MTLATDSVVDLLRADILDGVFSPGDRLIEVQLGERYSTGRASVRAALMQLESEVLVDRQANRGAVVHRISVAEAIQITEARVVLETLIAARAARHADTDDLAALEAIIDDMRDAVEHDNAAEYSNLNRQFHENLRSISRHTVASDLVHNLRNRGVQNQFRLSLMPGRQVESLEQHIAIADAIAASDEEAAAVAMNDHLFSVIEVLNRWGDAP